MDLKIKKYYATDGTPGGGTGDEQGGGSTAEKKIIVESKFRRETSNFKVNFDASSVDPESEAPVLIKYIEKNLKPEELLGLVVSTTMSAQGYSAVLDASTIISVKRVGADFGYYELDTMDKLDGFLFYVPSTGALSMNAPYVEDTTAKDIRIKVYVTDGGLTATVNSIESGLSPEDFADVPVEIYQDGQLYTTGRITSSVLKSNGPILLTIGTDENPRLGYNPSTGDLVYLRQSGSHTN